jgi:hypothetical protein
MSIFRGIRAGVFCLICASQPKAKVISFYLNSKAILTEKKTRKKKLFFKRTGPKSSWVREEPKNSNNACCHPCNTTFSLSNMGRGALVSHENNTKHKNVIELQRKSSSSLKFF